MLLCLSNTIILAQTWRLGKTGDLKQISSEDRDDKYLLEVSKLKQLVEAGQTKAVAGAVKELKKDYPEIAGGDLDIFIEAETLYSKGKFAKAVRKYDKLMDQHPQSPLYNAALERQFTIANAFMAGRKKRVLKVFKIKGYAEGIKVAEKVAERAGTGPTAIKASTTVAKNYEERGKYDEAYEEWSNIHSQWPSGQTGKESLLAMARCKHAAYNGPDYDLSNLISAKTYYQNFKDQYPADAKKIDADAKITQIEEQLAYKHFEIAQYYDQLDNKQAANLYYQMVLDNWPDTAAAEMTKAAKEPKQTTLDKKEIGWKTKALQKIEKWFL